jgi:hypothetical protein
MKLNNTYILFDSGDTTKKPDWAVTHTAIANAISAATLTTSRRQLAGTQCRVQL